MYTITEVPEFDNEVVLLNFENGTLKPFQEKTLACSIYENVNDEKVVAVATDQMVYCDKVIEEEFYDNYVVIHKKNSNKIVLIKANSTILKPIVKKREPTCYDEELETSNIPQKNSLSDLNKQFGSKRARAVTEQRERMKLDIDTVKEQLQETVADIKIEENDLIAKEVENFEYRPPLNRNASRIEDVYVLKDIVSTDILSSLTDEANKILETGENEISKSTFIIEKITELQKLNLKDLEFRYQILLYVDCIIQFLKTSAKEIAKRDFTACPYSNVVNKDILDKFTMGVGYKRTRSKSMRDKAVCYVIVLVAIACNFSLDLEPLSKEVKVGIKSLQEISRYLGFTTTGKSKCTLKLPLPQITTKESNLKGKRSRK